MKNLHKPLLFAGVGTTFVVFALLWFLFSFPSRSSAAGGVARVQTSPVVQGAHVLEMHIAGNGQVLLRNARVETVNGGTIAVSMAWNSVDFKWTVLTDASSYETRSFGTRFFNRNGDSISLNDIQVGDYITVTGMLVGTAEGLMLDASSVRSSR